MKEKLTISDIARLAGVGKSTVSRYFNGGYLKESTRVKIAEVVSMYNYVPNPFAQSLKAKNSKLIGVVLPTIYSRVTSRVMKSMDEQFKEMNYRTIMINTNHNALEELEAIRYFVQMKVDGIVLFATQLSSEHYAMLDTLKVPFISIGQEYMNGISIVNSDFRAGFDIGKKVGEKGYRKVAYVGVSESDEAVGKYRKEGVLKALEQFQVEVICVESDFTYDTTRQVVSNLLKQQTLDALICATDNQALAAYKEIQMANKEIKKDIALVAFGGYETSQLLHPSLYTLRFRSEEAGELAANMMISLIKGDEVNLKTLIQYDLVEGESL